MKKLALTILATISFNVSAGDINYTKLYSSYVNSTSAQQQEFRKDFSTGFASEMKNIADQVPMQIDSITTLDAIAHYSNKTMYNYGVNTSELPMSDPAFIKSFKVEMRKSARAYICSAPATRFALKLLDMEFMYTYTDADTYAVIEQIRTTEDDCANKPLPW